MFEDKAKPVERWGRKAADLLRKPGCHTTGSPAFVFMGSKDNRVDQAGGGKLLQRGELGQCNWYGVTSVKHLEKNSREVSDACNGDHKKGNKKGP